MILKDKERNKIVHKYQLGQNVYILDDDILKVGVIIGIEFSYNTRLDEMRFIFPKYAIEIDTGNMNRRKIYKDEYEIFSNKYECVMYALEHGLVKEALKNGND